MIYFGIINLLINILIKNWFENMIKIHKKLVKFNWNMTLIVIDNPISLMYFESDGFCLSKLLESNFESSTIWFGIAYCLSLENGIDLKISRHYILLAKFIKLPQKYFDYVENWTFQCLWLKFELLGLYLLQHIFYIVHTDTF